MKKGHLPTLLLAALLSSAGADSISVNLHVEGDSNAQADHEFDGVEIAGAPGYAVTTWNNVGVGSGAAHGTGEIFPSTALSDNLGNTAAATLATSANSTWFVGYAASSAANANELNLAGNDDDLFNSYLALNGPSGDGSPADAAVLQVSGLAAPYTTNGYSLVIYSETDKGDGGGSGNRRSVFTVSQAGQTNIAAFTEDDSNFSGSNNFDGTYVLSDGVESGADYSNYVIIPNLTAASFTLEVTSPDGGRGGLSGFQIVSNGSPLDPLISSFTSADDDNYIVTGDFATLSWTVANATQLTLDPGSIDVTGLTSLLVSPLFSTTYTLTASNAGTVITTADLSLTVGPPLPEITTFTVDDSNIEPGQSATLSWTTSGFDSLTLDPGAIDVTGQTSLLITPSQTTVYTLTGTVAGGTDITADLTVDVGEPHLNIVIFLVDDMGVTDTSVPFIYDSNGQPIANEFGDFHLTPNMEALAANGMKFTQAYATPVCSSTRASLLTGLNTTRHGVISQVTSSGAYDPFRQNPATNSHAAPNNWKRTGMQADDITMPMIFGDAGYRSIFLGKGHYGSTGSYAVDPTALGFDVNIGGNQRGSNSYTNYSGLPNLGHYSGTNIFLTDALTIETNNEIERAVEDDVPFLIHLSHYAVHSPFSSDPNATGDYSAGVSNNHRNFATMLEGMDISLGQTIDKLEELGVAEETLIVFLGDNGSDNPAQSTNGFGSGIFSDFPQRGKKATAWEGGIHVPFIVSWAKPNPNNQIQAQLNIPTNSIETDLVTVWDVLPTLLNVADVETTQEFDGYDLSPYLTGQAGNHRPQEFLMYLPIDHRNDFFAVFREGGLKLHYFFADDSFQLYDIPNDLTESNDLTSTNPKEVVRLARKMALAFEDGWGIRGELWPTFNTGSRPNYPDDPFVIDYAANGLDLVDCDNDGLPDAVEDADGDGLVSAGETDPELFDTDGDGSSDQTEIALGLDPLDASEVFTLCVESTSDGKALLTWPSVPGTSFNIVSSTDLSTLPENWAIHTGNIPADASGTTTSIQFDIDALDTARFFAIELQP